MKYLSRMTTGLVSVMAIMSWVVLVPGPAQAADSRIDLKVLVVSDGGPSVSAIDDRLQVEGVPHRTVDLNSADRPVIDDAFLEDTVDGVPRAKYQAVVLPNANPFSNDAEMTALAAFETKFGIRQVDAFVYPNSTVGMDVPGYSGPLDGTTADLSPAGLSGPFQYLNGPVRFDDNSPSVPESYGYLASPLPNTATADFTPYLTGTEQGTTGTLAGVYNHDGRSEMVLTFAYNSGQWQFRTIGHGIITWVTKGVHLGYSRNYFAVNIDDVFLPDSRWDSEHNCTPGEDCPAGVTTPDIRMTPDDVTEAVNWEQRNGFTFDLAYNGAGSDEAVEDNGSDPLTTALLADRSNFRWVNHTYEHAFLGCVQDTTVIPWRCQTDAAGNVTYVSTADIEAQVRDNLTWARSRDIDVSGGELVTGEHSGLKILPQQPDDNPNLAPALNDLGIGWLGSDASRDPGQRPVGNALTLPRYPISVFYNTATKQEMADEYNWIYTSRADGGSGVCEDHPDTVTCISPIDTATGFDDYVIPVDTRITLSHILANDPRPHYAHQSNLTGDRVIYPMLDRILAGYHAAFAGNTPLVNQRMSALGAELQRQDAWASAMNDVTAYTLGGRVTIQRPDGVSVPVTVPEGTQDCGGQAECASDAPSFGDAYAGDRSAYVTADASLAVPPGATG